MISQQAEAILAKRANFRIRRRTGPLKLSLEVAWRVKINDLTLYLETLERTIFYEKSHRNESCQLQ